MNLFELGVANGRISCGGVEIPVQANGRPRLVVGLRPEALELAPDGIAAEVEVVEEVGADAFVFCVAELDGLRTKLVARSGARTAPERGERVALRPKAEDAHLFDPDGGTRLP